MNGYLKNFWKLFGLQIILSLVSYGFAGLLYLHFSKEQVPLKELFLAEGIFSFIMVLLLIFRGTVSLRRDIQGGFILGIIAFILLLAPFSRPVMYVYFIFRGIGNIVFYVGYNILYFQGAKDDKRLEHITWYWVSISLIGMIGPILGGVLLQFFGLAVFVTCAVLLLGIGVWMARSVPLISHTYTIRQGLTHIRSLRTICCIDGALHKIMKVGVPVFALLYIQTEFSYGKFLSLVAAAGSVAALGIAKISDKLKKRTIFIWPLSFAMMIVTALFYFSHSLWSFTILAMILQIITVMTEPIRSNIIQDVKEKSPLNWISREIFLNIGRTTFFFIVVGFLSIGLTREIFFFFSFLSLLFPIVVWYKKIYATVN